MSKKPAIFFELPPDEKQAAVDAAGDDGVTLRLFGRRALEIYRELPAELRAALVRLSEVSGSPPGEIVREALVAHLELDRAAA